MIEIMVDVFHDKKLITPFIRDREDDWHVSWRREFDAKGHFDFTVPFDPTTTKTVFMHHDLTEIVREAQARKIKDINVRGLIRVVMTPEEVEDFERDKRIEFDIEYDVTLLNYTTFDGKCVVLNDPEHLLGFTDYLRLQVTSSLTNRIARFARFNPCAMVTLRRK